MPLVAVRFLIGGEEEGDSLRGGRKDPRRQKRNSFEFHTGTSQASSRGSGMEDAEGSGMEGAKEGSANVADCFSLVMHRQSCTHVAVMMYLAVMDVVVMTGKLVELARYGRKQSSFAAEYAFPMGLLIGDFKQERLS